MTISKIAFAFTAASLLAIAPAAFAAEGTPAKSDSMMKSGAMAKKAPKAPSSGASTATGGPVGGKTNKN